MQILTEDSPGKSNHPITNGNVINVVDHLESVQGVEEGRNEGMGMEAWLGVIRVVGWPLPLLSTVRDAARSTTTLRDSGDRHDSTKGEI